MQKRFTELLKCSENRPKLEAQLLPGGHLPEWQRAKSQPFVPD